MGIINPRAICPNCGAKIHTQGRRWEPPPDASVVGIFKSRVEDFKYRPHVTGTECPFCHIALTGMVLRSNNKAERAQ